MKKIILSIIVLITLNACATASHKKFADNWEKGASHSEQNRKMVREIEGKEQPDSFKQKHKEMEKDLANGFFNAIVKSVFDFFDII